MFSGLSTDGETLIKITSVELMLSASKVASLVGYPREESFSWGFCYLRIRAFFTFKH